MTDGHRFVVLGLAGARAGWFRSVGAWATSGALPAEFVKCVSAEEVRARLASGRRFSALVADAGLPGVDRDLCTAAGSAGCAVLVVDTDTDRDWLALGAARVLPSDFGRDDLLSALASAASPVNQPALDPDAFTSRPPPTTWRGSVVAVTGPGGTGASTAAMALAQALGQDAAGDGQVRQVVLADLRLNAEQGMLHRCDDVVPGVQELVQAHRLGRLAPEAVRALAFDAVDHGYHLLLGLPRSRFWPALRPRSFEAAFDSLQATYAVTVCDVDADLEGEDVGGSIEVEERNVMARTAIVRADAVVVVGLPSVKGIHSLVRVMGDLAAFGVAPERVLPVLNRTPRSPRSRARLAATVAELGSATLSGVPGGLVFLPEREIERHTLEGSPLPGELGSLLVGALGALMRRVPDQPPGSVPCQPEQIRPGSLGAWADQA
ncbi:MAG: hypothetical protein ACRD0Q_07750 [Acidimicrobiales bacterium]